jgi:hypothetical protein
MYRPQNGILACPPFRSELLVRKMPACAIAHTWRESIGIPFLCGARQGTSAQANLKTFHEVAALNGDTKEDSHSDLGYLLRGWILKLFCPALTKEEV